MNRADPFGDNHLEINRSIGRWVLQQWKTIDHAEHNEVSAYNNPCK